MANTGLSCPRGRGPPSLATRQPQRGQQRRRSHIAIVIGKIIVTTVRQTTSISLVVLLERPGKACGQTRMMENLSKVGVLHTYAVHQRIEETLHPPPGVCAYE
jgi:hypothetical protein